MVTYLELVEPLGTRWTYTNFGYDVSLMSSLTRPDTQAFALAVTCLDLTVS